MAKKKKDEFVVPDSIEPFVGFRAWEVRNLSLFSVTPMSKAAAIWPVGKRMEALCNHKTSTNHEPPEQNCSCGIYAARTFDHLAEQRYQEFMAEGPVVIAGTVWLWGKVIQASHGFRAQYAYPKRLWIPHYFWKEGREVAKEYKVKTKLVNTLVERED